MSPRLSRSIVAAVILSLASPALLAVTLASAADRVWNNAAGGQWSNPANWTPADVPDAYGETAVLPALGGPYQVTLDLNPAIDALQLATGPTLDLGSASLASVSQVTNAGTILGFRGVLNGAQIHNQPGGVIRCAADGSIETDGEITNDGTIIIGPAAENTLFLTASTTFEGSGTLLLEDAATIDCPLDVPQTSIWVVNKTSHTIRGSGYTSVPIRNEGLLLVDGVDHELVIHEFLYNYGTTRVSNGGSINVDYPLVENTGGQIVGSNGTFNVMMPYAVGGSIDNSGGGKLVADGGDLFVSCGHILDGTVERTGGSGGVRIGIGTPQNLIVTENGELVADGQIDVMVLDIINHGTVRVTGRLDIGSPAGYSQSLTGGGVLILDGGTLATPGNGTLVNAADHTIRGCGTIEGNLLNLGTMEIDCGTGNLRLGPTSKLTNPSTLHVKRGLLWMREPGAQLINAGGTITATGSSGGQIVIERGASINNTGGTIVANAAPVTLGWHTTASIVGGTLLGSGPYTNYAQTTLRDVTLGPSAVFVTAAGATTRARGVSVTNQGTNRIVTGGAFTADATTDYLQAAGTTVLAGGTLTVPRGVQVEGAVRGAGTIVGNVTNSGEVGPDAAGAGIQIQGDYHQLADGRLSVGLAGPTTFSRLGVTGSAFLDGTIAASLLNGFDPGAGQTFDVMSFGSRTGEFAMATGAGLELVPFYSPATAGVEVKSGTTAVDPSAMPKSLRFYSRGAAFALDLPAAAEVTVRAFDVTGREVATLTSGARAAGVHRFALRGAGGAKPPSGVYFARAEVRMAGRSEVRTARVVLFR